MTILPFVLAIIGILLSLNMKSIQSLQNSQLMQASKKIDGLSVLGKQDTIYENAVNDYCRKVSVDGCWSGVNPDQSITLADLEAYKPKTGIYKEVVAPFQTIKINQRIGAIEITHEFASVAAISKYKKHSVKQGEAIDCSAGIFPSCTSNFATTKIPLTQATLIRNFTAERDIIDADLATTMWIGQNQAIVVSRRNDLTQAIGTLTGPLMTRAELITLMRSMEAMAQDDYKTLLATL